MHLARENLRPLSLPWLSLFLLLLMPDGALLVSDDKANAIYRISYKK